MARPTCSIRWCLTQHGSGALILRWWDTIDRVVQRDALFLWALRDEWTQNDLEDSVFVLFSFWGPAQTISKAHFTWKEKCRTESNAGDLVSRWQSLWPSDKPRIGRCNFRSTSSFSCRLDNSKQRLRSGSYSVWKVSGALRLHITDWRQKDLGPFAIRDIPIADAEAERKLLAIPAFNREHRVFSRASFFSYLIGYLFMNPYPITWQIHGCTGTRVPDPILHKIQIGLPAGTEGLLPNFSTWDRHFLVDFNDILSLVSALFATEDRACARLCGLWKCCRHPRTECAWAFHFSFRKPSGKLERFSIHAQNTAETSQPQAQPPDNWRTIDIVVPQGLQQPWEKFGSERLSRKKANFVDSRKLLLRGYKLKKPNTTDSERDLQWPRLRRSMIDRRRRTWMPSTGRSSCFFFSIFNDRLTTLHLRFLLWK